MSPEPSAPQAELQAALSEMKHLKKKVKDKRKMEALLHGRLTDQKLLTEKAQWRVDWLESYPIKGCHASSICLRFVDSCLQ